MLHALVRSTKRNAPLRNVRAVTLTSAQNLINNMTTCYIGIGANLNNPREQILLAIEALKQLPKTQFLAVSSIYGSKPLGPQDQPDYQNAVAKIETSLNPLRYLMPYKLKRRNKVESSYATGVNAV